MTTMKELEREQKTNEYFNYVLIIILFILAVVMFSNMDKINLLEDSLVDVVRKECYKEYRNPEIGYQQGDTITIENICVKGEKGITCNLEMIECYKEICEIK